MIDLQLWEEFKKYREEKMVIAYKATGPVPTRPKRIKSFWFFKCYDKSWRYYDFQIRNYINQRNLHLKLMVPELTIEAFFDWVSSREKTATNQMEKEISLQLQKSEALRQSILKKAFSGQLVAQNAADEPASTLEFHLGKKFKTNGGWDATIVFIGERQLGVIHHVPKHWHGDGSEEFNWHMKDGTTTYGKGKYDFVKQPSNSLGTTLNTQANQSTVFGLGLEGKVLTQEYSDSTIQLMKNKQDEEA